VRCGLSVTLAAPTQRRAERVRLDHGAPTRRLAAQEVAHVTVKFDAGGGKCPSIFFTVR
jgi:hypothetical protein